MRSNLKVVLACTVAFGCGAGIGHILTKIQLERVFDEELAVQSEKLKLHYSKQYKTDEFSTPEKARQALEEEREESKAEDLEKLELSNPDDIPPDVQQVLVRYSGKTVPGIVDPDVNPPKRDVTTADIYHEYQNRRALEKAENPPQEAPKTRLNIWDPDHPALPKPDFVSADDAKRNGDKPYLMTADEYHQDRHYEAREVVYYTGDNTVADEDGEPIEAGDYERIFGLENLKSFGREFVVYVANPGMGVKYEVTRSDGTYSSVAGFLTPDEGDGG